MLLVTELFVLALILAALGPDTPFGKSIRVVLIERPARFMAKLTPAKIVIGIIVFGCLTGFAISAPELVVAIGFGDLAVYLDTAVVISLLAAASRFKFVVAQTTRAARACSAWIIMRAAGRRSHRRQVRRHRSKLPSTSDDGGPIAGLAFA